MIWRHSGDFSKFDGRAPHDGDFLNNGEGRYDGRVHKALTSDKTISDAQLKAVQDQRDGKQD